MFTQIGNFSVLSTVIDAEAVALRWLMNEWLDLWPWAKYRAYLGLKLEEWAVKEIVGVKKD